MRPQRRTQRGFALILVIWALVLLVSLASGFSYALRHEVRAAADIETIARAEAAATAALHAAVLRLSDSDEQTKWRADRRPHQLLWPDANITVRVASESGRIDLNQAPAQLLVGLFSQFFADTEAQALAAAVIDWRDRDDDPLPDGAERASYAAAGYNYGPTNGPFTSVNELRRVIGFNAQVVEAVGRYLTVYSGKPRIDAMSAEWVTLASVPGIDRAVAEQFITQRERFADSDERINFRLLRAGSRYLDTGGRIAVLAIDIDVTLDGGFARRERAVIRLHRTRGFTLLARESLPHRPVAGDAER